MDANLLGFKYVGIIPTHHGTIISDKHVCVYSFAKMYCLTLELHKGLADFFLIELNVRIQSGGFSDSAQPRKDVFLLAAASGLKQEVTNIQTMLKPFTVRTDQDKIDPGGSLPEL